MVKFCDFCSKPAVWEIEIDAKRGALHACKDHYHSTWEVIEQLGFTPTSTVIKPRVVHP